jgi:hypothetical protein
MRKSVSCSPPCPGESRRQSLNAKKQRFAKTRRRLWGANLFAIVCAWLRLRVKSRSSLAGSVKVLGLARCGFRASDLLKQ